MTGRERTGAGVQAVCDRLATLLHQSWVKEPDDLVALHSVSLPPLGNMACALYCNFDLFWAGEQLDALRDALRVGRLGPPCTARAAAVVVERVAQRLGKWGMSETVDVLMAVTEALEGPTPPIEDLEQVLDLTFAATCRLQCLVDSEIPWSELSAASLVPVGPAEA